MRAGPVFLAVAIAAVGGLRVRPAAAAPGSGKGPNVLRVDNAGRCPGARFTSIQDAVDAARENATVVVCAGTYAEQLVVGKRVRIVGVGHPVVQPVDVTANTTSLRTGSPIAAAAVLTAPASFDGVDFDLSQNGLDACDGPLLMGVFFRGTSGAIRNAHVRGVRHPPAAGACATGSAIVVQGNGGTPTRVDVTSNVVSDYERAGIVVNERGARATVRGNTVTGAGGAAGVAQNGIQVGFGATATVSGNVVQNNEGPSGDECTFDAGNLFFQANGGDITGNTFTGNTAGVILNGSNNRVLRNTVDGFSGAVAAGLDGISVFGDRNLLNGNTVRNVSEVGIRFVGNANVAVRNTVADTHEATLCTAARALPGCAGTLAVCGVGLWIAGGTGNSAVHNVLTDNDVAIRDEGQLSVARPAPAGR